MNASPGFTGSLPQKPCQLIDPRPTFSVSFFNSIEVGFKEIWAHKFRSALTMLGIILGVASLVAMSAMVNGMEKGLKEALVAIGGLQKIRVEAASVPVEQRHLRDFATGLTLRDVYALQNGSAEVEKVSPEMRLPSSPVLAANGKTLRNFMTAGCWPIQLEIGEHRVEHGRMFNEIDNEEGRPVCVIGSAVRNELFGSPEDTGEEVIPVGREITINGQPFKIIGMFEHYEGEADRNARRIRLAALAAARASGQTNATTRTDQGRGRSGGRSGRGGGLAYWYKNQTVYLPLNSMWQKLFSGQTNLPPEPRLSDLEVRIKDVDRLELAVTQVRNILMVTHRGIEDFSFRTQEDWADQIKISVKNARLSGGFIAAISLFVGGIGIMNIMLASISERIREIGIRKAVGAGGIEIFMQILVESIVIAVVGGLLGLVASRGVIWLISNVSPSDNTPVMTMESMLFAFCFSVIVGLLAGLFPAYRAARMNVIQALRYD